MKNGNWIPIDKNAVYKLSPRAKENQHSEQSAYLSLRLDLDNNNAKGLREYGRIWNWSRSKVVKFYKKVGYNAGDTLETKRRQRGDKEETPIRLILNTLEKPKRQRGDKEETKGRHLETTTINPNPNPKNKKEKEKERLLVEQDSTIDEIILYLNEKAGKKFDLKTAQTRSLLRARLKIYTIDEIKTVIERKCISWLHSTEYNKYLRPKTLFSATNFENYHNETDIVENDKKFIPITSEPPPVDENGNRIYFKEDKNGKMIYVGCE